MRSSGDCADAITRAMRFMVMDRGDFGTGDWFLVKSSENEFRLDNVGIALRADGICRHRVGTDRTRV